MPVRVTRLPGEPIIVAEVRDRMDVESIRSIFSETVALASDVDGYVYRIVDFLNAQASIRDMANALVESSKRAPGSTIDPRVKPVMVAGHNRIRFLFDAMRRKEFGGIEVPVFDTMDEALTYVRQQLYTPLTIPAASEAPVA